MLSCDNPVILDGQSPTNIATTKASLSSSPQATRLPLPALSHGNQPNGQQSLGGHHIWLVTGPAGCGKSTVGKYLATSLNLPYIEGDEVSTSNSWIIIATGLTRCIVPPESKCREDEQRYPPYRCRSVGLAHMSTRRIAAAYQFGQQWCSTHMLCSEAEV